MMSEKEHANQSGPERGGHIPVLLAEVITAVSPSDEDHIVDCTFGAGGYSKALLDQANIKLTAIDRDPEAISRAETFKKEYGERFSILKGRFGDLKPLLAKAQIEKVDAIVLDIGVSSFHLDDAERGFSFQNDGPLDMRMSLEGESAADVVNTYDEEDIANIIYEYGEEKKSRRIAKAIVDRRQEKPFTHTLDLAELVAKTIGYPRRKKGGKQTHPATRTFQALRIHVNDELGELKRALEASLSLLKAGGRLVVVSFHSLEDRIVKKFMIEKANASPGVSRHVPIGKIEEDKPLLKLMKKGAVKPGDEEIRRNPRSRSSRLRAAIRTDESYLGEDK